MNPLAQKTRSVPNGFVSLDFIKPLMVTFLLVTIYIAGLYIRIPFMNANGIAESLNVSFSIFMMGIKPYAFSYILIEILSLFVPPLKRLRHTGRAGRRKLKGIALGSTVLFGISSAHMMITGLKQMVSANGTPVLNPINGYEHLLLVGIMVVCLYALVGLSELISKFGIGNGISIILLSELCAYVSIYHIPKFDFISLPSLLLSYALFGGLLLFAFLLLKIKLSIPCQHENDQPTVNYFQLNMCPSSTASIFCASSLLMWPISLSIYFGFESSLPAMFHPGSLFYTSASLLVIVIGSFLFGWVFLHPRKRLTRMRSRGWRLTKEDPQAQSHLLKTQMALNFPWVIFLCLLVILPQFLTRTANTPFYIGGLALPLFVAIVMDLCNRFNFSRKSGRHPVRVTEFHDVYDANMIKNHLNAVGIVSYLQGYHHRLLLYFFGPHIDITLIVAKQDQEEARAIIRKYYGGLGL